MSKKALLLFDIDGTLITMKKGVSRNVFSATFENVFEIECPSHMFGQFAGRTDRQIVFETARTCGLQEREIELKVNEFFRLFEVNFEKYATTEYVQLLQGAYELVNQVSKNSDFYLMLLTGNIEPCAWHKLQPHGLHTFFSCGSFGELYENRTDLVPVAFEVASKEFNIEFERDSTVIIGDTPNDIRCATEYNLKSLAVATGHHSVLELQQCQPTFVVENFLDTTFVNNKLEQLVF